MKGGFKTYIYTYICILVYKKSEEVKCIHETCCLAFSLGRGVVDNIRDIVYYSGFRYSQHLTHAYLPFHLPFLSITHTYPLNQDPRPRLNNTNKKTCKDATNPHTPIPTSTPTTAPPSPMRLTYLGTYLLCVGGSMRLGTVRFGSRFEFRASPRFRSRSFVEAVGVYLRYLPR